MLERNQQYLPLTTNIETLPGSGITPVGQVFTAGIGQNPQGDQLNTLQTGDVLNGSTGNVLNATIINGVAIIPTLNNIATVNLTAMVAMGAGGLNLALSSNSASTVGDVNSLANTLVTGFNTPVTTLNKTGGLVRNTTLTAAAATLAGATDTLQVNLSGQTGGNLVLTAASPSATNGYDIVNIASTGSNTIGQVTTGGSVDAMTLTGGSLSINGQVGATPIDTSVATLTASALTGALSIGRIDRNNTEAGGASTISADAASLNFTGSNNGNTLFVDAATLGANDTLRGGTGNDVLVLTGASRDAAAVSTVVAANAGAFTASSFETLRVTDTDGGGAINAVAFNLANVTGLTGVQLNGGNADSNVVTLNNLVYSAPVAITATGTGAAGALALNGLNIGFTPVSVFGNDNAVSYAFGNGGTAIGANAVTSGALTLNGIEALTFAFNDLSVDVDGGAEGSTVGGLALAANAATSISVTSTGGSARTADAINFGDGIGATTGSVTSALINSTAAVTVVLNQAAGATAVTAGAGNHSVTANVEAIAIAINGSAGTGAQTFVGNSAADNIIGGTGNDTITGGAGVDVMSGGGGADDFIMTNIVTGADGAGVIAVDNITDFTVAQADQIGNFSLANLYLQGALAALETAIGATAVIDGSAFVTSIADVNAAVDFDTLNVGTNLVLLSGDFDDAAAVQVAIRANVTADGTKAATDGFLVAYDTGVNTFIAQVTGAVTDNNLMAAAVVTNLTQLSNFADATTLTNGSFLNFIA